MTKYLKGPNVFFFSSSDVDILVKHKLSQNEWKENYEGETSSCSSIEAMEVKAPSFDATERTGQPCVHRRRMLIFPHLEFSTK